MKIKDLKINFRYLGGNIACLSVDSIDGESVHNDINNEEAIIIFNSLVSKIENCKTIKSLLKENQEFKKQLEEYQKDIKDLDNQNKRAFENMQLNQLKVCNMIKQQKEFIKWLGDEIKHLEHSRYVSFNEFGEHKLMFYKDVLQKYKSIIGVEDEKK